MKPAILLLGLLLTASLAAADAKDHEASCACCERKAEQKPDPCCVAEPPSVESPKSKTENYSSHSLYQLDASFTDDAGHAFALGDLRGRPVVIAMFFSSCGYACPLTVTDLLAIQGRLPPAIRERAAFVLVSFDTAHDTPAALAKFRAQRGLDARWVLLNGSDDSVRELAALLGLKYKQLVDGSFSHSNAITVLNAEGEIVHQRPGLQGGLDETAAAVVTATR